MKGNDILSSGSKEDQSVVLPSYIVELAKSGRAECKKCDSKIDHKTVRVGVIVDGQWGLTTRWQHLECTIFHKEIKLASELDGYQELDSDKKALVEERLQASTNEVDDDDIPINPDELVRKAWDSPMDPPDDLLMPLLAYQKEGLGWMVNQEQSDSHGGILADEMGMGKTIQAISLMLAHRPNFSDFVQMREWAASDERHGQAVELLKARTLIVLPTVAIRQWQTEIARFTRNGALSVKVYHGSDRNTAAQDLAGIDIVLTSYKILEIEYRKATAGTKVTCRVCGKKFYPEKLRVHRRYFCGEDAQRTEAQALTQKKKQRVVLPSGGRGSAVAQSDGGEESEEDEVAQQKRRNNQKLEQQQARTAAKKKDKGAIKDNGKAQKKKSNDNIKENAKISWKREAAIAATNAALITNRRGVVRKETTETLRAPPVSQEADERDSDDDDCSISGYGDKKRSPRGVKGPGASASSRSKAKSVTAASKKGASGLTSTSQRTRKGGLSSEEPVHRKSRRSLAQVARNYCPDSDLDLADSDVGGRSVDSGGGDMQDDDVEESVYGSDAASADKDDGDSDDSAVSSDDAPSSDANSVGVAESGRKLGKKLPPVVSRSKQTSTSAKKPVKSPRRGGKQLPAVANKGVGKKRFHEESSGEVEESSVAGEEESADSDSEAGAEGGEWSGQEEVEQDIQEAVAAAALALKRSRQAPPTSVLHQLSWFRIILDEAHLIKDRSTSTAKAVFNLVSLNKWCLTGTPLQNRVGELYSLVRFLRVDPYAFYYCRSKQCTCKSLHYRFTNGLCDDCGHSAMQHYCHFNKHILNPIKRSGYVAEGRKAMLKLKQQVLDEILLRRTKTTRAEDIQLPPRVVRVRQERLDEKEEDFYQALYTQSQAQFNTYLQSGTVLNNYAHIFDILIRLRQAVDHPYLVIYSDTQTAAKADADNFLTNESSDAGPAASGGGVIIKTEKGACDLCHEPWEEPVVAECGHTFCRSCIVDYIDTVASTGSLASPSQSRSAALRCPDCDSPLTVQLDGSSPIAGANARNQGGSTPARRSSSQQDLAGLSAPITSVWDSSKGLSRKSILDRVDLSLFQSSTKIEALMEELHRMQSDDLGAKAIVFSQFVNMLDLINYRVQRGGIACVKLSGSMNLEQRDKAISAFKSDPSVKVMLISLKAGGVALNLTVASRIFLMDPWWNPAAEMQAIDRTHRIGQCKPIYATRFIIENTIEERILRLQEKKKLVFDGTVGGDAGSMSKLTVDDMRFLFN